MKVSDEKIKEVVLQSLTMRDASEKLNIPFMSFKRKALKLGLYKANQGGKNIKGEKGGIPPKSLHEILQGLHPTYSTRKLKIRLLEAGIKEEKCEECGLDPIWNDKKLILQLDHKDGNNQNHLLENLQILCPNCHSQTPTFCGKNKKIKNSLNGSEWEKEQLKYISLILNSNIDFSKKDWTKKVSKILNRRSIKVRQWMKRFMPDFYINCC